MKNGQYKYVPYEIKEATMKNGLGIVLFGVVEFLFNTPTIIYKGASLFFVLNWINTCYKHMNNAITRIDLHDDGKNVTLTYKGGSTKTVSINNIYKKKHERELVSTYEESYLFPISLKEGNSSSDAYILGQN